MQCTIAWQNTVILMKSDNISFVMFPTGFVSNSIESPLLVPTKGAMTLNNKRPLGESSNHETQFPQ